MCKNKKFISLRHLVLCLGMTCSLISHHPKELRVRVVKLHGGPIRQGHIKNPHLPLLEHYSSLSHTLRIASLVNTSQHERGKKAHFFILQASCERILGIWLDILWNSQKPKVQQEP